MDPTTVTARQAVDLYLRENGFDESNYDEPRGNVSFLGVPFTIPNPPSRQRAIRFHDLHHVATGYGTDLAGEAEISAWELRAGLGSISVYVRALVSTALILGIFVAPLRMARAYRAGKGARSFFANPRPVHELYAMNVDELRRALGVPENGIAGPTR